MDALRGAAAFAVVFAHAYNALHTRDFPGHGYLDDLHYTISVAVPIFFALSGFLLFRPYLAAIAAGRPLPSAATFFRRRALRVLPAYWVALTVCAIVVPDATSGAFSGRWWVFYLFGQSYSLTENYGGLAVAWTLSVDVAFYLLLPLFAWLVARGAPRFGWQRAAWLVIVPLLVIGPVVRLLNTIAFASPGVVLAIQKITYALPGEINFFAVGMALAVVTLRPGMPRIARHPTLCWGLAALAYLTIAAFFSFVHPYGGFDFRTQFLAYDGLTMAFVALVMLPTAFDVRAGVPRSVLSWRPLAFLGVVSYGFYLWHAPIEIWLFEHGFGSLRDWDYVPRVLATTAVVAIPTLAAATLSYYVVELPFLRRK